MRALEDQRTKIIETSITRKLEEDEAVFNLIVTTGEEPPVEQMVDHLMALKGVKSFKIG